MDSARWERIQALFHDALEQAPADRRSFLELNTRDDDSLLADVQALIDADSSTTLLDRELSQVAGEVLAEAQPFPRQIGSYHIRGVIGEGGMGVVYLAERADLGSRAAIKLLRDAWLSPARRERFASEQRTLAQLNHPCITHLYDADTLPDGTPYLVMEYVEGVPITAYCATHGLSITERLQLFRAVCVAVQHAHAHAIIHRDLKPSNILVTADGTPKLLDFGISKQIDNSPDAQQTRTALRLMTPAYAAPEQVRGDAVGTHTDVYALGVILYELLTGRPPFDLSNLTPGRAETVILEQDADKPSTAWKNALNTQPARRVAPLSKAAWADLDVLCLTAMHKDPQRRYRTTEALLRDLDHYQKREALEVRPDTFGYRLGKFLRRNRTPVSAGAAVLTLLVALTVFYTIRLARARDTALAEVARTQRIQSFVLNLFHGGEESVGPSDTLHVVTLVDRGVREAGVLSAEPDIQAALYHTLGGIYQQLGNFVRADSLLRQALEQRRRILPADHPDVMSSMVALGMLRADQAELPEAEQLIRDGIASGQRSLPPAHPALMKASWALGSVLEERGDYPQAIRVLDQAARLQSTQNARSPELATTLTELANTHFYAGNFSKSDSLNRIVLDLNRQIYGEQHPKVADILINLGAVQYEGGHYGEAEQLYRHALGIIEGFHGAQHPATASALTMLGRALVVQKRYDDGLAVLQRALTIQERVYGLKHPAVASIVNELGIVSLQRGDLASAEAQYKRNVELYRAVYGEQHYLLAIALSNLSSVYLRGEQYARAEVMFRDVVQRFSRSQSPRHLNTGIARIKLGRALQRQGQYAEAEEQLLAGYEIVARQTAPGASWLVAAREDLVALYEARKEPEKAARWRSEIQKASAPKPIEPPKG